MKIKSADNHGDEFEKMIANGEIAYDGDVDSLNEQWVKMILMMLRGDGYTKLSLGNVALSYGVDSPLTYSIKVLDAGFFNYVMIDCTAQQYMMVEDLEHHNSIPPHIWTQKSMELRHGVRVEMIASDDAVDSDQKQKEEDRKAAVKKYQARNN